jgi:hypothetical protein
MPWTIQHSTRSSHSSRTRTGETQHSTIHVYVDPLKTERLSFHLFSSVCLIVISSLPLTLTFNFLLYRTLDHANTGDSHLDKWWDPVRTAGTANMDLGPSADDAGWTVDGPDRALGVQLKGLSVSRGGKSIVEVRVESIDDE